MTHNTWHVTHDKHSFALDPLAWHWPPSYQWWEAVDTLRFLQIEIVIEILFTRRSVTPTASHLSPHTSHYWMILNVDYCSVLYWQGQSLEPNVTIIKSNVNIYNTPTPNNMTFVYLHSNISIFIESFLRTYLPLFTKVPKKNYFLDEGCWKHIPETHQLKILWESLSL